MLSALFRWLETRVDIFAPFDGRRQPPSEVWRFMWSQVRDMKLWLGLIIVSGLCFSLIEASLYLMVGWFVDLLAVSTPETLWRDHGWQLLAVAGLILIIRPLVYFINHAIVDQVVVPPMTNRIRWRGHVYVLGHAISTFNNDFAGRIATRVMQSGQAVRGVVIELIDDLWYVLGFRRCRVRLLRADEPVAGPAGGALVRLLCRTARVFRSTSLARSEINSRARSKAVGASWMPTPTRDGEAVRKGGCRAWAVAAALKEGNDAFFHMLRLITGVTVVLNIVNSILIVATAWLCLHFWSIGQMTPGPSPPPRGRPAAGADVGLGDASHPRHLRECRHGAGESRHDFQAASAGRSPGRGPAVWSGMAASGSKPSVSTTERARACFDGLDLDIRPGERIGLVGPSGAGKSTLVSLILRLHDLEGRADPDRRAGHRACHAGFPASADRCRDAGHVPSAPLDPRQHRLWPGRRDTGRDRGGGGASESRRLHPHPRRSGWPHRLRQPRRRTRREALRGPAAANRDRARAAQGRADPDPRRSDLGARLRERGPPSRSSSRG